MDGRTGNSQADWLYETIARLTRQANLPMPEVGIYESPEVNAFATGPSKSRSLVAVSSGLLRSMRQDEVEGVLAHEVAHIANGDMVTMTLLQGVLNAFVMFLARVIGYALTRSGDSRNNNGGGSYFLIVIVLQIVLGILGGAHRELVLALPRVQSRSRRRHAGRPRAHDRRTPSSPGQPRARGHAAAGAGDDEDQRRPQLGRRCSRRTRRSKNGSPHSKTSAECLTAR